jgi:hypothetical protein
MRCQHWELSLNDYLKNIGSFQWGKNDCCMFSVNAVKAMTNIDYGKTYKYTTELGAAKILAKAGGVEAIASKWLGKPKSSLFAKRGDVVSFESGKAIALGICIGGKIAAMKQDGLAFLPMSKAKQSWSV